MCGRFSLTTTSADLAAGLHCPGLAGFREERRYNIAPGQWVIVVRPERGERVPELAQWGFVPSWAKDSRSGPRPINARAEGAATNAAFRGAFRHGRCLIPASGFYEWQMRGKGKQPFFIRPAQDQGLLVFAGLFSRWEGPAGPLPTCTILTTTPNEAMAPIHDRMPVILAPEDQAAWLDPANPHAAELLRPCPAAWLTLHPVDPAVGNPRNDGPELQVPLPEPILP